MKKLLIFLREYKKETILAPLFKLLEASFELLVPLVMAAIIDKGIHNKDQNYILKMGLILIVLGIVGLICSLTAQYFAAKAAVGFSSKLRRVLFSHMQQFSFSQMDSLGTSTMITRMTSDINQVQTGVNLTLRLFLRSPFIVFGAMIMAFFIDYKAALWFVAAIILLSCVVFSIMFISIPLYKKVQEKLDKVLSITRENLTGVRVIRAFHKEDSEIEKFRSRNKELFFAQNYVGKISGLMNPVTYILINAALAGLIWTGAIQVEGGILTQGAVVALINYMSQILVELIKLATLIITVTKAVACGNRIQNVLDMKTDEKTDEKTNEKNPVSMKNIRDINDKDKNSFLEFCEVGLKYENSSEEALTQISFRVERGQSVGIIGGTGSGKSSLVNLIPRFYENTSGTIKLNGRNIQDYSIGSLRGKIGVVMQNAVLFKGTVADNLKWGKPEATDQDMWEALETSQSREFVDEKDGKLEATIAQGGKNLSGGQKQRLTIARALIKKPEILILDDSASALDFTTDAALRRAIREMKEKPTVFVVSQRASSVMGCDVIIVLEDGKSAGTGTHRQLLESCQVYQEIYYSQFEQVEQSGKFEQAGQSRHFEQVGQSRYFEQVGLEGK